jgi:hypothetical protein
MLAISTFTQEYIDKCRARINSQLVAYKNLLEVADLQTGNDLVADFEAVFFNNLLLVLDNLFANRGRALEKKDGNPLNEFRIICNSLLHNDSKMLADKSIKLDATKSVLKYHVGDEIVLNEAQFRLISEAFFAEIEIKFLETCPVAMN